MYFNRFNLPEERSLLPIGTRYTRLETGNISTQNESRVESVMQIGVMTRIVQIDQTRLDAETGLDQCASAQAASGCEIHMLRPSLARQLTECMRGSVDGKLGSLDAHGVCLLRVARHTEEVAAAGAGQPNALTTAEREKSGAVACTDRGSGSGSDHDR